MDPTKLPIRSQQPIWYTPRDNGFRNAGIAVLWALAAVVPVASVSVFGIWKADADKQAARLAFDTAYETLVSAPAGEPLAVETAIKGRALFASSCMACHGSTGAGIDGLGKDLVHSDFVAMQTDTELHRFIAMGRPGGKPVAMPPRGGRTDLTDEDLSAIVVYVRGLQDPRRMPELPEPVANAVAEKSAQDAALAAAGGDAELAGYIASGNKLFHASCVACHGAGGVGVSGNGKALVNSEFIRSLDDDGLLAFIKQGRPPTDPKNSTGIQMPPKGGNPAMSDDDILDVIAYLRTLQGGAAPVTASK